MSYSNSEGMASSYFGLMMRVRVQTVLCHLMKKIIYNYICMFLGVLGRESGVRVCAAIQNVFVCN